MWSQYVKAQRLEKRWGGRRRRRESGVYRSLVQFRREGREEDWVIVVRNGGK